MSVLVGIVSRNREMLLPKAIDSALNQDPSPTIAVYDDNSSDGTSALQARYPQVHWEFGKKSKGYVFARNKFMKEATDAFFCSLDDDSWFIEKSSLATAIDYLNNHDDVAAIAFDILSPDRPRPEEISAPRETNMFIGCGHVLRIETVKEVGWYEPNPGFYGGEEKDLCIRLMDEGLKIMLLPGIHVWHDKTNLSRDLRAQHRSGICNDLIFTYRRTPLLYVVGAIPLKVWKHFWFSFHLKEKGMLAAATRGILDFLKLFLLFRLTRKAVRISTFRKFMAFNSEHFKQDSA